MAFRGEIDDRRHSRADGCTDGFAIADIAAYKAIARIRVYAHEICEIAGVREAVEIDHHLTRIGLQQITNEIAADEAATASHQHRKHPSPRARQNEKCWSS